MLRNTWRNAGTRQSRKGKYYDNKRWVSGLMAEGIIYRISFPNGKIYVGQTVDFYKRKSVHVARVKKGSTFPVHNAMRKYPNYVIEEIQSCSREALNYFEYLWIFLLRSLTIDNGYNLELPNPDDKGKIVSQETRDKISKAMKGRTSPMKGRKQSPEARAKIGDANRGRKNSQEHIAKSAAASKGRKHTPESITKMSLAKKGKKQSKEHVAKRVATKKANKESRNK